MRTNKLREMHRDGQPIVNAWLSIGAPYAAESICHQGFDSATIDCQHGMIGFDTAVAMLHAISSTSAIPLVRPSGPYPAEIMRFLDAGSYGIICPMISTRTDAETLVAACRYPPVGQRSFGPARAQLYGGADYLLHANAEILALAMIETAEGLRNLDAILDTPGLDGIYVGPNDLSLALGYAPRNEPVDDEVRVAIERIRAACTARGMIVGIFASDGDAAQMRIAEGFGLVTPGNDAALLRATMADAVRKSRSNGR